MSEQIFYDDDEFGMSRNFTKKEDSNRTDLDVNESAKKQIEDITPEKLMKSTESVKDVALESTRDNASSTDMDSNQNDELEASEATTPLENIKNVKIESVAGEVEVLETTDVIGGKYYKDAPKETNEPIKEQKFGVKNVADRLNVTTQCVRDYISYFDDYIQAEKNPANGYNMFTEAAIERLRYVMRIKNENGWTYEQTKAFIENRGENQPKQDYTKDEKILQLIQKIVNSQIEESLRLYKDSFELEQKQKEQLLLEDQKEKERINDALKNVIEEQNQALERMKDSLDSRDTKIKELEEASKAELSKVSELIDKMERNEAEHKAAIENAQELLSRYKEELDQVQSQLDTEKNRKWWQKLIGQ